MRKVVLIVICIFVVIIAIGLSCSYQNPPAPEVDVLEYSAAVSVSGIFADISYRNGMNEIVYLENEALPWAISFQLGDDFTGEAYLKVEAAESEVYIPFLTGKVSELSDNKLIDKTPGTDFISSGVIIGDKVFKDPSTSTSANVFKVDSSDTLSINFVLFSAVNEDYYIYHEKTLTAIVKLNSVMVDDDVETNIKKLAVLVQARVDR
jgi:hypothetical protein